MLKLTPEQFAVIVEQGRQGKPLEICGLLAGRRQSTLQGAESPGTALQGDASVVEAVFPIESDDKSEVTYSMNPLQQMRVEKEVRAAGLEIVGIYHTHPATQPYPSKTDVARAHWGDTDDLLFPEYSYLIVSLRDVQNPEPRSYKIRGRRIPEDIVEEMVVID
ncbi:MAG: [CysO sulfur-carrier protein]-S-L-cysteine hydrolase [Abditibacteriota bacterium]|nr:[CysO sulfur-carrier protein]-S-L-cysteine hydrolase [Abditibacteriota bacterium]